VALSVKSIGRTLLPWAITVCALWYVFGYAIDWKAIPEASANANLPLFIGITVFDKVVFFLVWAYNQTETIRRFIEPVSLRQVIAIKGGAELMRAVNNSLADATFFFGVSQITKSGMVAVIAVAFIPFGAHFTVLLVQGTVALLFLPGGLGANRDVAIAMTVCWLAVGCCWIVIRRGYLDRLLANSNLWGWLKLLTLRSLLPFFGYFALFGVFDILIQGLASRAFGVEISWIALAARIPILYFAISIPSLANFGTREIAWANLFSEFGTREELTAFALWTNVIFLVMHVAIGAMFVPRAISLVRDLRKARRAGELVRAPLIRDPIDP
jgi:hypothetical protein